MRICRIAILVLIALWLLATALLLIGMFGLMGQQRDPLSGVFLIPLGLPWSMFIDRLPSSYWPLASVLAPFLNIAILHAICKIRMRRGR